MNWIITEVQFKKLLKCCPFLDFKSSYVGDVSAMTPLVERGVLNEILDYRFKSVEICDAGFYGFNSVGMHVDNIFDLGFKTLAIFIDGVGSLQYFKNKDDYEKVKISDLHVRPKSLVIFDQNLPHSFSLGYEEKGCVALLAGIK
jgi:hypothetical protein